MGTATGLHPMVKEYEVLIPATAAGVDAELPLFIAPFAGTVTAASYTPVATITGADTNSRTLQIKNRGLAGAGTVTAASKAFTNTINAVAYDEKALDLSGTATDLDVAEGAVVTVKSLHVGTGLADPGGLVRVTFKRD